MTAEEKIERMRDFRAEVLNLVRIRCPTTEKIEAQTVLDFDSLSWTEIAVKLEELFPSFQGIYVSDLRRHENWGALERFVLERIARA